MSVTVVYNIDVAAEEHLDAMFRIEQQVSPFPWTRRELADSLAAHSGFVLRRQRKVMGFVFFSRVLDEADLLNIAIHPSFQGEGHGARLLGHCFERLKGSVAKMFLEVRASNVAAISLYLSNGFVETGVRRAYYWAEHGREDALVMCRHFEPDAGS